MRHKWSSFWGRLSKPISAGKFPIVLCYLFCLFFFCVFFISLVRYWPPRSEDLDLYWWRLFFSDWIFYWYRFTANHSHLHLWVLLFFRVTCRAIWCRLYWRSGWIAFAGARLFGSIAISAPYTRASIDYRCCLLIANWFRIVTSFQSTTVPIIQIRYPRFPFISLQPSWSPLHRILATRNTQLTTIGLAKRCW